MTEQLHLELEDFLKIPYGAVFASGRTTDSSDGLNVWGMGRQFYWVAVKGYADDWALYCGREVDPEDLKRYGDKVYGVDNIRSLISVSDEVLEMYRR